HVAAQAAVGQRHCFFSGRFNEKMIDGDLSELVDDDQRVGLLLHQLVDQRGLAAAEEAGDHHHRRSPVGDHTFISRQYSPPPPRSTVNTMPRSSTNTSFSWICPVFAFS